MRVHLYPMWLKLSRAPIVHQLLAGTSPTTHFHQNPAQSYSSSFAVFNNTSPNGLWSLYVVDDASGDMGNIAGGWTLELDITDFHSFRDHHSWRLIPPTLIHRKSPWQDSRGNIRKVRVSFLNHSHTFPDDLDMLLVGPGGQNAIIMSGCGWRLRHFDT